MSLSKRARTGAGPSIPNVLVIGMAGAGKSTYLNDTFGSAFLTARSAKACTKKTVSFHTEFQGEPVKVWDCPGLFDAETNLQDWSQEMIEAIRGTGFQQILFVVNATTRAGTLDTLVITGLRMLLKDFSLDDGVTTIFTHCDAAPEYYEDGPRSEWVETLNRKCKLKAKGLTELDVEKTLAFVAQEKIPVGSDAEKEAKRVLHVGTDESVGTKLAATAADKIIPAMTKVSGLPFTPIKLGIRAGRAILKEVVDVCGQETADEYACYDAATSWVTRLDTVTGKSSQVLAVDINPGDKIIGRSLVFEEVLVKNVQHPKLGAFMRKIEAVSDSGHSSSMTLSLGHYVPVFQSGAHYAKLLPSRDVQIGDVVQMQSSGSLEFARVKNLEDVKIQTTVSLRTQSLTMVVNGIVGSSRAEGDTGLLGHGLVILASMLITNGGQKLQNLAWSIEAKFHFVPLLRKLAFMI